MNKEVKGYIFACISWNESCLRFVTNQIPREEINERLKAYEEMTEIRISNGDGVVIKVRADTECDVVLSDGNEAIFLKKGDYLILTQRSVRVMRCNNFFERWSVWKNMRKYSFVIS